MSNTKKEKLLKTAEQGVEHIIDFVINIFDGIFRFCKSLEPDISKIRKNKTSLSSVGNLIFSGADNTNTNNKVDITE